MNRIRIGSIILICWLLQSCAASRSTKVTAPVSGGELKSAVVISKKVPAVTINVKHVSPDDVVTYAETLVGVPYRYGSMKRENGFDCSGFINFVFNHFKISVPRTSAAFTNAGLEVKPAFSKKGDLILFTGSDEKSGEVGHMGIVVENKKNRFTFIHASTSQGVMVSTLNSYFIPRFVKVIRIFL